MSNLEIRPVKNQEELEDLYYQRWLVLRAPLSLPRGSERDKYDDSSFHLVALSDKRIIGSARIRSLSPELASIAYLAVLKEFRNQGVGTKLLKNIIAKAQAEKFRTLRLMSRLNALGFYQRLGFLDKGQPFNYLGIEHIFMYLNLPPYLDNGEFE